MENSVLIKRTRQHRTVRQLSKLLDLREGRSCSRYASFAPVRYLERSHPPESEDFSPVRYATRLIKISRCKGDNARCTQGNDCRMRASVPCAWVDARCMCRTDCCACLDGRCTRGDDSCARDNRPCAWGIDCCAWVDASCTRGDASCTRDAHCEPFAPPVRRRGDA
jgi:hypothetical protein